MISLSPFHLYNSISKIFFVSLGLDTKESLICLLLLTLAIFIYILILVQKKKKKVKGKRQTKGTLGKHLNPKTAFKKKQMLEMLLFKI